MDPEQGMRLSRGIKDLFQLIVEHHDQPVTPWLPLGNIFVDLSRVGWVKIDRPSRVVTLQRDGAVHIIDHVTDDQMARLDAMMARYVVAVDEMLSGDAR